MQYPHQLSFVHRHMKADEQNFKKYYKGMHCLMVHDIFPVL